MPDFLQTGSILTLPLLSGDPERLDADLAAWSRERPLALLLPCHARDLDSPALTHIIATVATIRGSPAAPWAWGVGMALASGVAYLRVAGDAHWASDVLVGAAVGGGIGFAVPWFLHRRPDALPPRVEIVPASAGRGLALRIHVP